MKKTAVKTEFIQGVYDHAIVDVNSLHEPDWNCRIHTERGISSLCESIRKVGWIDPIIVWKDGIIIAGSARWKAAKKLKMDKIPILRRENLTEGQAKWYSLASNRIPEFNGYDEESRYQLAKSIEDMEEVDLGILFTEDEMEERRNWAQIDVDPPEPEETDIDEPVERPIQNVEITIQIPAGLWPSIQEEIGSLVKGLQDRHPEVLYTVKELPM